MKNLGRINSTYSEGYHDNQLDYQWHQYQTFIDTIKQGAQFTNIMILDKYGSQKYIWK